MKAHKSKVRPSELTPCLTCSLRQHWVFLRLFPHLQTEDNNRLSWGLDKVKHIKSSEWHQLLYRWVPWLGSLGAVPFRFTRADSSLGFLSTFLYHLLHTYMTQRMRPAPCNVPTGCHTSRPSLLQCHVVILASSLLLLKGLILLNGYSSLVLQEMHTAFQCYFQKLHEIPQLLQDMQFQFIIDWYWPFPWWLTW